MKIEDLSTKSPLKKINFNIIKKKKEIDVVASIHVEKFLNVERYSWYIDLHRPCEKHCEKFRLRRIDFDDMRKFSWCTKCRNTKFNCWIVHGSPTGRGDHFLFVGTDNSLVAPRGTFSNKFLPKQQPADGPSTAILIGGQIRLISHQSRGTWAHLWKCMFRTVHARDDQTKNYINFGIKKSSNTCVEK